MLMLEVLLTRIVSVVSWYHLAFFVISLSMLGMTAGAIAVFLRPSAGPVHTRIVRASMAYAAGIPISLILVMAVPLMPIRSLTDFAGLALWGGLLAIPFGFAGIAVTLVLTRVPLPPARTYGADLVGAAVGCASIIVVLDVIDACSAALLCGALGAAAAFMFSRATDDASPRGARRLAGTLALLAGLNAVIQPAPLRPGWVKGVREVASAFAKISWNTHSRVTVSHAATLPPMVWAKGRNAPDDLFTPILQRQILIDGAAATFMTLGLDDLEAHPWIDWDISSFAHQLRPEGAAAVIGVGGGRDILAAARTGHQPIVGLELNADIVALHTHDFREESGLVDIPGVELHTTEARRFLREERRRFSVIAMSLIDTWASTGAGAYALSESGLYTREAWRTCLDRLTEDGIFTVSRWYLPTAPGETARMLVLAMETLYDLGIQDPHAHLILLQNQSVATLLVSRRPFSGRDLDTMQAAAVRLGFNMVATPRKPPAGGMLKTLWTRPNRSALREWARSAPLDLTAPSDDRPFFFQMLKPSTWLSQRGRFESLDLPTLGNLHATQTLVWATVISLLLTLVAIFAPLLVAQRRRTQRLEGAGLAGSYFALIGCGFMFVEIGMLSRLDVLLGDPVRALAVLLGSIILGAGCGSLLSDRFWSALRHSSAGWLFPLVPCGLALAAAAASTLVHTDLIGPSRVGIGFLLAFIPGLGMGVCFPIGLTLAKSYDEQDALGPWLWGINGATGVCASSLALGCSMVFGISTTLIVGAGCYLMLLLPTRALVRRMHGDDRDAASRSEGDGPAPGV